MTPGRCLIEKNSILQPVDEIHRSVQIVFDSSINQTRA